MHHLESLKGKKTWLWHETPNPEESKKWDWSNNRGMKISQE